MYGRRRRGVIRLITRGPRYSITKTVVQDSWGPYIISIVLDLRGNGSLPRSLTSISVLTLSCWLTIALRSFNNFLSES